MLESIVTGVPMICWPYSTNQTVNSRLVSKEWKVGLVLKIRSTKTPKYEFKLVVIKRSFWIPKFKRVMQITIRLVIRTAVKDRLPLYSEIDFFCILNFFNLQLCPPVICNSNTYYKYAAQPTLILIGSKIQLLSCNNLFL